LGFKSKAGATTVKQKKVQTFPVMDGALGAPREDQIAGIVQRVWADSRLYHGDVEPMLREWLNTVGCVVADDEFQMLLAKARGEFARGFVDEHRSGAALPGEHVGGVPVLGCADLGAWWNPPSVMCRE
jgi:hypothetical protein